MAVLVACLAAGLCLGPTATQSTAQVVLTEEVLTGVELSGWWRHTGESGSEWRLVLRDPSGELLTAGPVDVEHAVGTPDETPATASSRARSLLLDVSRPESAEGPDTLLVRLTESALAENLGLLSALERLGLADSLVVSASPDLANLNIALGVEGVLPPVLRFGSKKWAHFLRGGVHAERLSPDGGEPTWTGLGSRHGYWGRGWGWQSRRQAQPVLKEIARAIEASADRVGQDQLGDPGGINDVLTAARSLAEWRELALACTQLERPIGPGAGQYQDYITAADAGVTGSLGRFLSALAAELERRTGTEELRARVAEWAADPQLFLDSRVTPVVREHAIVDNAFFAMMDDPELSREAAFRAAREAGTTAEELANDQVSLLMLVDAIDPTVLSVYRELVMVPNPAGDLPVELLDVVDQAFRVVPWGERTEWHESVVGYVAQNTLVWKPRWLFAADASAHANWGEDIDPAALLDVRLTWRPDPFTPYGLTLAHKRGKEESNRERRLNWTSLEFTYRF
jgi:hypothetical protein